MTSKGESKSEWKTNDANIKAKHRKSHTMQEYDKQRGRLDGVTGVNRAVRAASLDAKKRQAM